MSREPHAIGATAAALHATLAPQAFGDLEQGGALGVVTDAGARETAWREWDCFALYACVRGLVAALGFNRETAAAIDALHDVALAGWRADEHGGETLEARRRLIAERYAEYGAIGQAEGARGAATVTARLGAAAARHMVADHDPGRDDLVGRLHEAIAEGVAEALRGG
jgi:hypothetical protein